MFTLFWTTCEGRPFTSVPKGYSETHLPDGRKAPNDLTKFNSLIHPVSSIVYQIHTLKYSIGHARTSLYCSDHVPTVYNS